MERPKERIHRIAKALKACRPQLHNQSRLRLTGKGFGKPLENAELAALRVDF
jgi:hypothetical protein